MPPKRTKKKVDEKNISKTVKTTNKSKSNSKSERNSEKEESDLTRTFQRIKQPKSSTDSKQNDAEVDVKCLDVMEENIEEFRKDLKAFDLNCDYGPFIGITRHARLTRAEYFNFQVDEGVRSVLKNENFLKKHPDLDMNIWHDIENLL